MKARFIAMFVDDPIDKEDARRASTPIICFRFIRRGSELIRVSECSMFRTAIFLSAVSVPT